MKQALLNFEKLPRYTFLGQRSTNLRILLALGLLAIVLAYVVQLLFTSWQTSVNIKILQEKIQALRAAPIVTPASQPKPASLAAVQVSAKKTDLPSNLSEDKKRNLNTIVRQLNIPWYDIFEQLEKSTPQDVALLSVEPDGQRATIKIQAEAKSLDSLLAYAAGLQQQGIFGRLSYSKHETNDQDPNKPIRLIFELEVKAPARLAQLALEDSLTLPKESVASPSTAPLKQRTKTVGAKP